MGWITCVAIAETKLGPYFQQNKSHVEQTERRERMRGGREDRKEGEIIKFQGETMRELFCFICLYYPRQGITTQKPFKEKLDMDMSLWARETKEK